MTDLYVTVRWRLAISGREGLLKNVRKDLTLGGLSALLDFGSLAVILPESPPLVLKRHADRPFALHPDGAEVEVELLVQERWPAPASSLVWKDVDAVDAPALLVALLQAREGHGVRSRRMRVTCHCGFVVDGAYLFATLDRSFDVWCEYLGGLHVDGRPVEPLSVSLHSDIHTLLEPVTLGRPFTLPLCAAFYTSAHLRFELDPSSLREPRSAPLRLEFDACVGLLTGKDRSRVAAADHVTNEWALSQGAVAWNSSGSSFLEAEVTVCGETFFNAPAPHLYTYASMPCACHRAVRFQGLFDAARGSDATLWHESRDYYCELRVLPVLEEEDQVPLRWTFKLLAHSRSTQSKDRRRMLYPRNF